MLLEKNAVDYTNTFYHLTSEKKPVDPIYNTKSFNNWYKNWMNRIKRNDKPLTDAFKVMRNHNPRVIPRNHIVENILKKAVQGNLRPLINFLNILNQPYADQKDISKYQLPSNSNESYQTFCGT